MNKTETKIAGDMETIITVETGSPATVVITKAGFDVEVALQGGNRMTANFPATLTPAQICDMTADMVNRSKSTPEALAAAFATKATLEAARATLEEAQQAFEQAAAAHGATMATLNAAKAAERTTALVTLAADADVDAMAKRAAAIARHIPHTIV